MDNEQLKNHLQDKFYTHRSSVDVEALWEVVNPKKQRKNRLFIIWWSLGFILIFSLAFFFINKGEATKISEKLEAKTNVKIISEFANIDKGQKQELENNAQNVQVVDQNRFYKNKSSKSSMSKSKNVIGIFENIQLTNQEINKEESNMTSNDYPITNKSITRPLDEVESTKFLKIKKDYIVGIPSLPHRLIYPSKPYNYEIFSDIIKPIEESNKKLKNSIGAYFSAGSFVKKINSSNLQRGNAEKTESPFLFLNTGLEIKRKITDHFYAVGGINIRQYQNQFQYVYSEIKSEEFEVVVEEVRTQDGIKEILGNQYLDVKYEYNKDIISKNTQVSGFLGLGYKYPISNKFDVFAESTYHLIFVNVYEGQLLWLDEGVKQYDEISNHLVKSQIKTLGNKLGVTYYLKSNTSIGIFGNLFYDLSSTINSIDQRQVAWSLGMAISYDF